MPPNRQNALQLERLRQPRRSRRLVPEVGLPSRVRLPTNCSPQESGEEAGDIERHLHPGLSPLGSPDVASVAFEVEGPGGLPPALPGILSDGSDNGQAAPDPSQPPSSRLEDIWRIISLQELPGNTKDILRQGGADPQKIDTTEPGNPSRDIFVRPTFHSIKLV
jgi:hypothetical protein